VTSRTSEIQSLIADIDQLLSNKRLSKFFLSQTQQPRQVLERVREFLLKLSESDAQAPSSENQQISQPLTSPLLTRYLDQGNNPSLPEHNEPKLESTVEAAQQENAFMAFLAPLQAELQTLLQERTTLVQEIRQLEQRRQQNYSLVQQLANQEQIISEFLQVLMNRLVPGLKPHITETTTNFETQPLLTNDLTASNKGKIGLAPSYTQPLSDTPEQVEKLTRFARELDQRLLALDGTVNVVFSSLERNIHTYHESLSEALARMHSKGVQGEQLLASLISNLIQNLEQPPTVKEPFTPSVEKEDTTKPQTPPPTSQLVPHPAESLQSPPPVSSSQSPPPVSSSQSPPPVSSSRPSDENITTLEDQQQSATNSDLDSVLVELNQNQQNFLDSGTTIDINSISVSTIDSNTDTLAEIPQKSSQLNRDEVDELYASLFATPVTSPDSPTVDVVNPEPEVSSEEVNLEVTDITFDITGTSLVLSVAESPTSTTNQLPQQDTTATLPDPWFDESDTNLELSDTSTEDLEETSEQSSDVGIPALSMVEEPSSADTITTLSDIFAYVENAELLSEDSNQSPVDLASTVSAPSEPLTQSSELKSIVSDEDQSLETYISASPAEDLLFQAENEQGTAVPEISLGEEQLQQLEEDLAKFDGQINSELQPETNIANSDLVENTESTDVEVNSSAFDLKVDVEEELLPETEKKNIATETEAIESYSPSISNFTNSTEISIDTLNAIWYLGIDLGTTGISATLLNRSTTQVYPIYWLAEKQPEDQSAKESFRLPAEVYLPTAAFNVTETETKEAHTTTAPGDITEEKVPTNQSNSASTTPPTAPTANLFSAQLKPYLHVALPYKNQEQKWEPVLQLNELSTVPLVWVVHSLSKLLLTLKLNRNSTTVGLTAAAIGISQQSFLNIIDRIAGVICNCPSNWSEQYRFNVREALLLSELVQHPQQVFFVEEAIASVLSELDGANGETVQIITPQGSRLAKTSEHPILGNTLVVNSAASATEMALVDLPENLEDLTHSDFMLHSFAYAGKGIEQDIICQLLLPPKWRQSRDITNSDSTTLTSNPKHWTPSLPGLENTNLSIIAWEQLNLPRAGEPDITERICLQQRLESSLLGKALIDAAIAIKLILQHQESFTVEIGEHRWVLQRRDLESQVFVPFVRRLNRELNRLLVAKGIPTEGINQVILTGGVACLGAVSRWLRQKLPNAKIIQDAHVGENTTLNCSRVAYGLAVLPLHPQVIEVPRQQYTDYFLFTELLRLLPERALSFNEVIQLFEARGINTRICQQRLLAFLEGELPPGLIPSAVDSTWLTQSSNENSDYQAILKAPLFDKQGSLTYRPNSEQLRALHKFLDTLKASTQQSLDEPYTVNFAIGVIP
jgi:hypothetical protein